MAKNEEKNEFNTDKDFTFKWHCDHFTEEHFFSLMRQSQQLFFLSGGGLCPDQEYRVTKQGDILEIISKDGNPKEITLYGKGKKPKDVEMSVINMLKEIFENG